MERDAPLYIERIGHEGQAPAQMPQALEPPWPNPFNGSAVLRYRLPESQDIEVAVYNSLGQKVRLLHEGPAAAGGGQLFWDGRDDWGRPAASGIYFAVLKGDGLALHRRLLLLR